jgi:tol-pal system protein YbgF
MNIIFYKNWMPAFAGMTKILGVACLMAAAPVFAESAPVYDADALPQQFYSEADQSNEEDLAQTSPAEPNTFVPVKRETRETTAAESQQNVGNMDEDVSMPPMPSSESSEQRIKRLEQQVSNLQSNDSNTRIESLQKQVQSLHNQIDQLTRQLQQAQDQQKNQSRANLAEKSEKPEKEELLDSYAGETKETKTQKNNHPKPAKKTIVSNKVTNEGNENNNLTASSSSATDNQPNVAEEQQIYQTAYNLIKAKKYNDAVNALQKMLQKYPSGQFASNAHYWLGELYGLLEKHSQALAEFNIVATSYPDSPRVSDAQLKIGLIYAAQSKWSDAKASFKKVINRYPGTSSSRLASEQLKQIKLAGH